MVFLDTDVFKSNTNCLSKGHVLPVLRRRKQAALGAQNRRETASSTGFRPVPQAMTRTSSGLRHATH